MTRFTNHHRGGLQQHRSPGNYSFSGVQSAGNLHPFSIAAPRLHAAFRKAFPRYLDVTVEGALFFGEGGYRHGETVFLLFAEEEQLHVCPFEEGAIVDDREIERDEMVVAAD